MRYKNKLAYDFNQGIIMEPYPRLIFKRHLAINSLKWDM
ncbi:hypothetical protein VCRA2122O271_290016 [Vibrio crassostreae]|nr:hypothetical protein VCRA2113O198_280016 [Vibrio crassostreae]CAK1984543.1 hypothetical protein VCRA2110O180_290057 [Vibrio crassostreae]CAK1984708.1 hypothetical protein VCRA2112O189_280016 [Vibrio crassostreae]CAK2848199.1 hypothetical protein VCRA218O168_280016 [Vibrio crassostreae]CAK3457818.1 hypothetical protein VCRA2122O271_290016 [Vibrio crassostreae]